MRECVCRCVYLCICTCVCARLCVSGNSFPDTANAKLVRVTLAENHTVWGGSWGSNCAYIRVCVYVRVMVCCMTGGQSFFFSQWRRIWMPESLEDLPFQLSPNSALKTLVWYAQNIFHLSFFCRHWDIEFIWETNTASCSYKINSAWCNTTVKSYKNWRTRLEKQTHSTLQNTATTTYSL